MKPINYLVLVLAICSCGPKKSINNNYFTQQEKLQPDQFKNSSKLQLSEAPIYNGNFKSFSEAAVIPSERDHRFVNLTITKNKSQNKLNNLVFDEGLREVNVSGVELVLGGEDTHTVFEIFQDSNDISSLKIFADTIIIQEEMRVPSTNVEIRARKIIFKGNGKVNTTPIMPIKSTTPFTNGADGEKAGDILIVAEKIEASTNSNVLIANGGNGAPAGPGEHGARGTNAHIVAGSNLYYYSKTECRMRGGRRGDHEVCTNDVRSGRPSGNGSNAKVGGIPGKGGSGGNIFIPENVKLNISYKGGLPGKTDIVRLGGEAGHPHTTCREVSHNKRGNEHSCVTAYNGSNVEPKNVSEEYRVGKDGDLNTHSDHIHLTIEALKQLNAYASEIYKGNNLEVSKYYYTRILNNLAKLENNSLDYINIENEVREKLNQITFNKDFFGNDKNWVPNTSFEVNFKVFNQEIRNSILLLVLSEKLLIKAQSLEEKRSNIKDLQENLILDSEEKNKSLKSSIEKIVNVRNSLENLKIAENEFNFELEKIEEEIRDQAIQNLSPSSIENTIQMIKALSKVMPVGQPTFGLVGKGIEFIEKVKGSSNDPLQLISNYNDLNSEFKNFNPDKALKELERKLSQVSPEHLFGNSSNDKKIEQLNKMKDFYKPIIDTYKSQFEIFEKTSAPKDKIQIEIEKIKKKHTVFKKVTKALTKLLFQKEEFINEISKFNTEIEDSINKIISNYVLLAKSYDVLLDIYYSDYSPLENFAKEVRAKNLERLEYYHYVFVKSYEFRTLKKFVKKFDQEVLLKSVKRLVLDNSLNISDKVAFIYSSYNEELSNIIHEVISTINNGEGHHQLSKEYVLHQDELETLNAGEDLFLDLTKFFEEDKIDMRLNSVSLVEANLDYETAFELKFSHTGKSLIKSDDSEFLFVHPNRNSPNLSWISYMSDRGNISHSEIAYSDISLLLNLFRLNDASSILLQPGARTFLKLKLSKEQKDSNLKSAIINLEYSFRYKN